MPAGRPRTQATTPLTEEEERFVEVYARSGSVKMASEGAGMSLDAGKHAHRKPNVKAAIKRTKMSFLSRNSVTKEHVVAELKGMATFDPADAFIPGLDVTVYKNIREMPADVRRSIKKVHTSSDGEVLSVEFYDKMKAMEMLAKHMGLYQDNQVNLQFNFDGASTEDIEERIREFYGATSAVVDVEPVE